MAQRLLCFCFCLLIGLVVAQQQNCHSFKNGNKFEWKINNNVMEGKVTFVNVPNGWGAIGFKSANTPLMTGSSIVLGYSGTINEYYSAGNDLPTLNSVRRISSSSYAVTSGSSLIIYFERPLTTQNSTGFTAITNSVQGILFASAMTRPESNTTFYQHSMDYRVGLNLFQPSSCTTSDANTSFVTMHATIAMFLLAFVMIITHV